MCMNICRLILSTKDTVAYEYEHNWNYFHDFKVEWPLPNALADTIIWLVENKYLNF